MKISRQILRLCEAKEIFWHGTTSLAARKILKTGLSADEKRKRVWDETTRGKESYPGTYLTQNIITAIGSANNAVRKFGGYPVVFETMIETRTALYDEDIMPDMVDMVLRTYSIKTGYLLNDYGAKSLLEDEERKEFLDKLMEDSAKAWFSQMSSDWDRPTPKTFLNPEAFLNIKDLLVELAWVSFRMIAELDVAAGHLGNKTGRYRELLDQINRKLEGMPSGFQGSSFLRNIRTTKPVTFKGSNRITGAVTGLGKYEDRTLYVLYGRMSDKFMKDFKERQGDFKNVIRMSFSEFEEKIRTEDLTPSI